MSFALTSPVHIHCKLSKKGEVLLKHACKNGDLISANERPTLLMLNGG